MPNSPGQLESALVITLRDTINWESSVEASSSGTLPAVDPSKPLDPHAYLVRDRELGYRDLCVAAAVSRITTAIADIWHYLGPAPLLQGPAPAQLPYSPSEITITSSGTVGQLRHVLNASIPWDAARYADADLYGRDALVFEILARAAQAALTDPPISRIDSAGTLVGSSGSSAWSLAEGVMQRVDVSPALPLRRDLFKQPDQNLADRDNQMAAYVAQVAQVLKNPFRYADRLYFRVDNVDTREAEVYVLISDDGVTRVWQAEPALFGRFQIRYTIQTGLLQWFSEHTDEVHVPQLYAMSIPGIEAGQFLTTLPAIPELKDAQYWRQKAGQVVPDGEQLTDTDSLLNWTSSDASQNVLLTPDAAIMTVPSRADFTVPGVLNPGVYRVNVLVQPETHIEILGAENISATTGTMGGADYAVSVSSGSVMAVRYIVEGGAGIVYNGTTYTPDAIFVAMSGGTVYSQVNPSTPSTLRQYGVNFQLALPPGPWKLSLQYTDLTGDSTGFGVQVIYQANGANAVNVVQDITPLPFSGDAGTLFQTSQTQFDVLDTNPFTMPVFWTYGNGQFHLRKLIFDSDVITTGSYHMTALFAGSMADNNVTGINHLPDTMQFVVKSFGTTSADVSLIYNEAVSCPIKIKQIDVQTLGTYSTTPSSDGWAGWRQECLDRAESVIQQGYDTLLNIFGTDAPTFRTDGSVWNSFTNENWMSFIEITNPRLREVDDASIIVIGRQYVVTSGVVVYDGHSYPVGSKFYGTQSGGSTIIGGNVDQVGALIKSRPGHVGRPALIPAGLFIESTGTVKAFFDTLFSPPLFVACQPWMIDYGVYVVQDSFWMPEFYAGTPRSSLLAAPPVPPPVGVLEVSPIPLFFSSDVVTGSTGTSGWDITNIGGSPVTGTVTMPPGSFTLLGSGSYTVPVGVHESILVGYTPVATGTNNGTTVWNDSGTATFLAGGATTIAPVYGTGTLTSCIVVGTFPSIPFSGRHIYYGGFDATHRRLYAASQDYVLNGDPPIFRINTATNAVDASYVTNNNFAPFGAYSVDWDAANQVVIILSQAHGWATMNPATGAYTNTVAAIPEDAGNVIQMVADKATGICLTSGINTPGPTNGRIQIIQHTTPTSGVQLFDSGFLPFPLSERAAFSPQADKFIVAAFGGTIPFYYVDKHTGSMTPTTTVFTQANPAAPIAFDNLNLLLMPNSASQVVFIDPTADVIINTGTVVAGYSNAVYDSCNGYVYLSTMDAYHLVSGTWAYAGNFGGGGHLGMYFDKFSNKVFALNGAGDVTTFG